MLPADGLHELFDIPDISQGIFPIVDEDEIVSASLDLIEFDHENLFKVWASGFRHRASG
jgi:hypothetical protein